jgi:hypothetical protein
MQHLVLRKTSVSANCGSAVPHVPAVRAKRDRSARFPQPSKATTLVTDYLREFVVETPRVEQTEGDFSIVRVRPRHEKVFVRELRAEGVGFYLPLRLHKRYWHGQRRESWVPMFAGLVFVANGDAGRRVASDSRCITGYIPVSPSYQPQLRRELIQLETVLSHEPTVEAFPELLPGREVEVRNDAPHWTRGFKGKVVRREGLDVFVVLIETLGRQVEVSNMPGELLEVIEKGAA